MRSCAIRAGLSWACLIGLLLVTNPAKVPLPLLVLPFLLLYSAVQASLRLLSAGLRGLRGTSDEATAVKPAWWPVPVSLLVVILALLESLGQLTIRDTASLLLLFAVSCFYISRIRGRRAS